MTAPADALTVYYCVHLTGRDRGSSGIQRVSRNLAAALQNISWIDLVPVRWCAERETIVYAEQEFCDVMALFQGPRFEPPSHPGEPIASEASRACLLVPEVPHLRSHDDRYPAVAICALIGDARVRGMASAIVFHDLLPLTHAHVDQSDAGDIAAFTSYGLAISYADVIFPVSTSIAADLRNWWVENGVGNAPRCTILPTHLPSELKLEAPVKPAKSEARSLDFICVGTICKRKNQLTVMRAFNAFARRRPDLNARLLVVGLMSSDVKAQARYEAMSSDGRIHLLGFVSDLDVSRLIRQARATVFISLAEGFGLPVVESLWMGTPCICSNIGSIAEIAASGGCLTIDPTKQSELEDAFERLACDDALFERLRTEIGERTVRTWDDYAYDIADDLAKLARARATSADITTLSVMFDRGKPMHE